jgi:glycosyltransferase involved in cell wall biosynthesis
VRILYVWDAEYPWDVRTEKVCLALVQGGHEVVITARNASGKADREERPEGLVARMPAGAAFGRKLRSFPAFFNPWWRAHLERQIREQRIELVMVRDLPLAPTAVTAAAGRIPVVMDMAENYPAMIRDIWTDRRQRPLDVLVRNPAFVAMVERRTLKQVDFVITVVEESSERLVTLGLPSDRTAVVSNTPPAARVKPALPRDPTGPLRVIYLGLMEKHRGIGWGLDAVRRLKDAGVQLHLDLVGDGRDLEVFRAQAIRLGLTPQDVTFHGRLPHAEAIALVDTAHVGLVPHEARESWNTTISNKQFDYMAAGLAVISSDAVPAARVMRATGAGLVFRSGDVAELADCIRACVDLEAWQRFRAAGQEAIRTRYNWEHDTRILLDVVRRYQQRSPSLPAKATATS